MKGREIGPSHLEILFKVPLITHLSRLFGVGGWGRQQQMQWSLSIAVAHGHQFNAHAYVNLVDCVTLHTIIC